MKKNDIKQKLAAQAELFHSYNVIRVGLFGSWVRGNQNENSDIDILVDFIKPIDLFAYVKLQDILSQYMAKHVDLVTTGGIKLELKNRIMAEVEWIEGI